ncbi:hypothetical protein VAR608DRAFT_6494 [Variovorax sp. HW608]|uniref:hypothetical protein n=1 Tax=Variovorax sp. HW608 TaxID=1034889 RepID=UPI00081FF664|nr:hypothetical protein [Variovorax sp. HW608]SCK59660.1 hypothetical protein VAR608DRAFT_6494 [Variovorax sp. HW608]
MTNLKTHLLLLGKMLVASLALSMLLLIAAQDLFPLMSPFQLLLSAGFGVVLLIAVVYLPALACKLLQARSAAEGK